MSPRLVPLDRFLLAQLVREERDPVTAEMASGEVFAQRALAIRGLSYALLDGGTLVAGGGLVPMWPGRAEAWQLTSTLARPRQLALGVKMARRILDARQRDPAFRRIEMFVRCRQAWACSFILGLGFVLEGRLKRWDPRGDDVWLCSRVREIV